MALETSATPEDDRQRSHLETSLAGVFAVGDVRQGSVKRIASAVGEGSICVGLVHEYLTQPPHTQDGVQHNEHNDVSDTMGSDVDGVEEDTDGTPEPGKRGHIGRIVAGSLIGGLVAAVFLVAVPFAGRTEAVITGSVLLTFAAAWFALAMLSQRWTDQPQRWAFVPAAFMAVAGVVVLVLAPTGNELGWVWPPVVFALAVWMIVRARRDLHSRTRIWIVYPVCLALALSCIGGAYETYRESTDNFPMTGRLIDVGGHKLHIDCTGTGSPTVVLEPGLGEPSTAMAWIAPDVATTTRVCVYDRAGRGWSESAGHPQDGVEVATDLHTLLRARRRARTVRARRTLRRRHLRPQLRAPLPRAGRGSRPARLDAPGAVHEDLLVARVLRDVPPGLGRAPVAVPLRCRARHLRVRLRRPARSGS